MIVGIISKESHCKSHAVALQNAGYSVRQLGANGGIKVPASIDVLVCRPASSSHAAFDVAMREKRSGRPTIIANGVLEVLAAVQKLTPLPAAVAAPVPVLPSVPEKHVVEITRRITGKGELPMQPEPVQATPAQVTVPSLTVTRKVQKPYSRAAPGEAFIERMSNLLGVYSTVMHTPDARNLVATLANRMRSPDAITVWEKEMPTFQVNHLAQIIRDSLAGKYKSSSGTGAVRSAWTVQTCYNHHRLNSLARPVHLVVKNENAARLLTESYGLSKTKEGALIELRKMGKRAAERAPENNSAPVIPVSEPVLQKRVNIRERAPIEAETFIHEMSNKLGIYSSLMHRPGSTEIIRKLAKRCTDSDAVFSHWEKGVLAYSIKHIRSLVMYGPGYANKGKLPSAKNPLPWPMQTWYSYNSILANAKPSRFAVKDQNIMRAFAKDYGLATSAAAARDEIKKLVAVRNTSGSKLPYLSLRPGEVPVPVPEPVVGPVATTAPVAPKKHTQQKYRHSLTEDFIEKMSNHLGFYAAQLHQKTSGQRIQNMVKGRPDEKLVFSDWLAGIAAYSNKNVWDMLYEAKTGKYKNRGITVPGRATWQIRTLCSAYVAPGSKRITRNVVVKNNRAFEDYALAEGMVELTDVGIAVAFNAAPVAQAAPAPTQAQAPVSPPVATPVPPAISVPTPAPAAAVAPTVAVAAPVQNYAWDRNLRPALALALAEMKAAGVQSLTLNSNGTVAYDRIIVIHDTGSLTLSDRD